MLHTVTFHGVGPPPRMLSDEERVPWLDTPDFLIELDLLAARDDVRITFDDGNASDVEIALPALRERGLTATFFVLAGFLDHPGHVDRDGVRELLAAGMSVGTHGMSHRDWRELGDHELDVELVAARRELEACAGRSITSASCPFGSYDRRVLAHLRRAGTYRHVYTSDACVARPGEWLQPRSTLTRGRPGAGASLPTDATVARTRQRAKMVVKRCR